MVRGEGVAEVVATGLSTEVGKIGKALAEIEPPKDPARSGMKRLVRHGNAQRAFVRWWCCCAVFVSAVGAGALAGWRWRCRCCRKNCR